MQQFLGFFRVMWKKLPYRSLIAAILAAGIGMAAGRNILGRISVVSGLSMCPTFEPGMWVHSTTISGDLDRGDVVVLDDGSKEYALKRVVGLPGETVHVWRGYIFINQRILIEPYLPKSVYTFPKQRQSVFLLGADQYFVLGDNRPYSSDSRVYGPVERKQIKGRIALPERSPRARFGPMVVKPYGES
jgi:signal peptidase I